MTRIGSVQRWVHKFLAVALMAGLLFWQVPGVNASFNPYSAQSVTLGSNVTSASNTTYTFTFSGVNATSAVMCILVQFGTSVGDASLPTGMSTASAFFDGSSNYIPTVASWAIDNSSSATGLIKLTYATGETPASASGRTLVFTGITNPSGVGTYYAFIKTFGNTDCSTSQIDGGGGVGGTVAFGIAAAVSVAGTVNPTLTYTLGSTAGCSSMGTLAVGSSTSCSHTIAVTSNAASGYTLAIGSGSVTMTNQRQGHTSETIAAIGASATTSAPGTAQFGLNLKANTTPSVGSNPSGGSGAASSPYATADNFAFLAGDTVASTVAPSAITTYTVSYLANISSVTKPGSYTASVIYNVVANY